jgi:pyruvate/2-oxoglutarate dehydrogenase complex dihydrolipoamide acyltransferase (E2) component
MGNVAITSIGMMGNANGWFIPTSIHPLCFGISKISKKPVVIKDKVEIREILNMTILLDHDVIDGAPMARFISDLSTNISKGIGL